MKTPPTVRVELVIAAPRPAVWGVLVDFTRYPEWNPFTVGVQTTGRVGDPVLLDVQLGRRRLMMRERMRVNEPLRRIARECRSFPTRATAKHATPATNRFAV